MKKKHILIAIISIIIILILVILFNVFLVEKVNTSFEERENWNEVLNNNPYLSQMSEILRVYPGADDLLKLALSSSQVEEKNINEIDKRK